MRFVLFLSPNLHKTTLCVFNKAVSDILQHSFHPGEHQKGCRQRAAAVCLYFFKNDLSDGINPGLKKILDEK